MEYEEKICEKIGKSQYDYSKIFDFKKKYFNYSLAVFNRLNHIQKH